MSALTGNALRELMAQERTTHRAKARAAVAAPRVTASQLQTVFSVFDTNGNGNATAADLHLMCRSVGVDIDQDDVPAMLEAAGFGANGLVTFPEFEKVVNMHAVEQNSDAEAARVFGSIATCLENVEDEDEAAVASAATEDGEPASDTIDFATLRAALDEADARVSDDEIKEVIKYCGSLSGDGTSINKADWLEVMQFVREVGQ